LKGKHKRSDGAGGRHGIDNAATVSIGVSIYFLYREKKPGRSERNAVCGLHGAKKQKIGLGWQIFF